MWHHVSEFQDESKEADTGAAGFETFKVPTCPAVPFFAQFNVIWMFGLTAHLRFKMKEGCWLLICHVFYSLDVLNLFRN